MFKKEIIRGCEGRGDDKLVYLTRWILFSSKKCNIFLHKFSKSDYDDMHDHPWDFISIILWCGYFEETPAIKNIYGGRFGNRINARNKKFINMFSIIYRKAEHIHRVVLKDDKIAWSLVITFKKRKTWGFFTKKGFLTSGQYFTSLKC